MKLSPVDLNLLVALDALVRTESVTRAAQLLGMSKPAISHALARLRAQLQDPILVRSGQSMALSSRMRAARVTLPALVEQARTALDPQPPFQLRALDREFRIAASDHVISLLAVRIGREVRAQAPLAGLRFVPIASEHVVRESPDDLAIGVFPHVPGEFCRQRLFNDRLVCVVRRDHSTVRRTLDLATLITLDHVAIAPQGRSAGPLDEALAARGMIRRVTRFVPYFLAALDLVASSDCVTTLSEALANTHKERFGLRIFPPPVPLPAHAIHQVWHPRYKSDRAHQWLRQLILRVAAALPRR